MVSRRVLGDVGLGLLAVVTIGLAGYVVERHPTPPAPPLPAVSASPAAAASPAASPVSALVLRSPSTPAGHIVAAARTLGWSLTQVLLGTDPARQLTGRQVVLVQAGASDESQVVAAVQQVHTEAPSVRLVVVAPLQPGSGGVTAALSTAVTAAGGRLLDPTALGWVPDRSAVFTAGGSLTPAGAASVGEKLAAALS